MQIYQVYVALGDSNVDVFSPQFHVLLFACSSTTMKIQLSWVHDLNVLCDFSFWEICSVFISVP